MRVQIIVLVGLIVAAAAPNALANDWAVAAKKAATTQPAAKSSYRPGRFPYLKPEERAAKAKEALDPATGDEARYNAIWGLAISGYCRASAEALAVIACDRKSAAGNRWNAAMGLINFKHSMGEDVRRAIQDQLYGALDAEKENLPHGVIMTFIAWGDADRVRKVLGDKLRGHNKEVAVLERISSRDYAVARLWEIHEASPPPTGVRNVALSRRWHVGHALICRRDKRGIDILLQCLTVKETKSAERFSFRHSLHGTFLHLASVLKNDFGYGPGRTWTPQLNEAIPKMVEWWKANRETWSFEQAAPNVVPTVRPGKTLTERQARMLAAKLANDAFAERTFRHADGRRVGKIEVAPQSFNDVRQKHGRWVLRMVVSRGPEAFVDFGLDGTDAKVIVNYAVR